MFSRVAVIGGVRTPFVKAGTAFARHSALDLGVHAVSGLIEKLGVEPRTVEELVYGIVLVDPRTPNLAREIVLRTPLPASVGALTVSDNCITGTHAITAVYDSIAAGRIEVGIAGGAESMSNQALLFGSKVSRLFLDARAARTAGAKLLQTRPWHFVPKAPPIAEPSTGLTMGEHAEIMAKEWKVPRKEQDEIAYRSQTNAHRATVDGRLTREIHLLDGIGHDLLIRPDTSLEKLAKLPPVLDRSPSGTSQTSYRPRNPKAARTEAPAGATRFPSLVREPNRPNRDLSTSRSGKAASSTAGRPALASLCALGLCTSHSLQGKTDPSPGAAAHGAPVDAPDGLLDPPDSARACAEPAFSVALALGPDRAYCSIGGRGRIHGRFRTTSGSHRTFALGSRLPSNPSGDGVLHQGRLDSRTESVANRVLV